MRLVGRLAALAVASGLLVSMFAAVHRGARGRERVAAIQRLDEQRAAIEAQRTELLRGIEVLRSRARVVPAAQALGLRLPAEGELVILELRVEAATGAESGRR
ncbi:MAG: hypothetical protein HY702_00685 [Gemmatimonadetes bacterium]|nr:hypothetical protein [Gemmatimonadota bacterium]